MRGARQNKTSEARTNALSSPIHIFFTIIPTRRATSACVVSCTHAHSPCTSSSNQRMSSCECMDTSACVPSRAPGGHQTAKAVWLLHMAPTHMQVQIIFRIRRTTYHGQSAAKMARTFPNVDRPPNHSKRRRAFQKQHGVTPQSWPTLLRRHGGHLG